MERNLGIRRGDYFAQHSIALILDLLACPPLCLFQMTQPLHHRMTEPCVSRGQEHVAQAPSFQCRKFTHVVSIACAHPAHVPEPGSAPNFLRRSRPDRGVMHALDACRRWHGTSEPKPELVCPCVAGY